MVISYQAIFLRKVSTFLSLMIIIVLATIVGAIIIQQAKNLSALQEPLPLYISTSTSRFLE
ncbi:hypothetical protein J7K42_01090 [bacterium]|nr:hypothetical protein [bacterium]